MDGKGVPVAQAVPVGQGGYPMQQQGGYPMQQQGGYAMQQQGGYPMQQQAFGAPQVMQMQQAGYGAQVVPAQPQMPGFDPSGMMMGSVPPPVMGDFAVMEGRQQLAIVQRFQIGEAVADAVGCGCIEQENRYDIYDAVTGEPLLFVQERSDFLCRACCKPNHTARLEFYDARPGVPQGTLAMVGDKPFALGCCACAEICRNQVRAHLPPRPDQAPAQPGKHPLLSGPVFSNSKLAYLGGGGFTPTVEVMDREGKVQSTLKGPTCCVGGLVELCGDIPFNLYQGDGKQGQPVVGRVLKKKPAGAQGALKEAMGDADVYMLDLPQGATNELKLSIINNAIMLDYLVFEGGPPFRYNPFDNSCEFNCFQLYCFGCICPCTVKLGGSNNN